MIDLREDFPVERTRTIGCENAVRRVLTLLLTVCLCVNSVGCFTFAVRTENAKVSPYQSETVHAYLWNIAKPEPELVADCAGRGLDKVRAKANYLYMVVGILTFGGWVPMGLEWRCAPAAEGS